MPNQLAYPDTPSNAVNAKRIKSISIFVRDALQVTGTSVYQGSRLGMKMNITSGSWSSLIEKLRHLVQKWYSEGLLQDGYIISDNNFKIQFKVNVCLNPRMRTVVGDIETYRKNRHIYLLVQSYTLANLLTTQ